MMGINPAVTMQMMTITRLDAIQETKKTDVVYRWYY